MSAGARLFITVMRPASTRPIGPLSDVAYFFWSASTATCAAAVSPATSSWYSAMRRSAASATRLVG